jgi:SpoVK/Ycf46/Vps4 family AAA+-type ATPase
MYKRPSELTEQSGQSNRRRPRINLENAPPINSLHDLIVIGKSAKLYMNIDTIMLWRITPHLEELDQMIGMTDLKDTVFYQVLYYIQNMHMRNRNSEYLHSILCGPPGSGKTSAAILLAKIYQSLGVLSSNGPFRIAHRDDFVAGYLGQTAIKTTKLLESCLGGVLFIDEVYSLGPKESDKDSFAQEAIDTLTSFLSEHKNDFCCIAAGYEKDIENCLFSNNEGLRRRFQWIHRIQEYTPEELASIFIKMIKDIKWELIPELKELTALMKEHKELFVYAGGDMETMISKCKMCHAKRVFGLDPVHKFSLTIEDLNNGIVQVKKNKKPEDVNISPPGMYI